MKGGVTIPIHKEFIHPSTFGATHQGVLWQHPVPKDARFFWFKFSVGDFGQCRHDFERSFDSWKWPALFACWEKPHHLRCIFEKLLSWAGEFRNGHVFFLGEKLRYMETSSALRSRHFPHPRDAWKKYPDEDLEVWSFFDPLKELTNEGAEKEVWLKVVVTPCGDSSRWWWDFIFSSHRKKHKTLRIQGPFPNFHRFDGLNIPSPQ